MKKRRKRKVKNNYDIRLAKNSHDSSYKMKTYLEIDINGIYA
jgi:hypothetical protein